MSISPKLLTRTFAVGVLLLSTAYGASALTVKRTNKEVDGVFVPVLVVKIGDDSFVHQIGDDGLTRAILFNRKKALAWAREKYGAEIAEAAEDSSCRDYDCDDGGGGGSF